MQEVTKPNRELSARPALMPDWQRRAVLGLMLVLGTLSNAAFYELQQTLFEYGYEGLPAVLGGGLFAQASLLALWAGLGRQPLAVRMPAAIGVSAICGLALLWGDSRSMFSEGASESACAMLLLVLVQALLLLIVRRYWGWQISTSRGGGGAENAKFGLRQVLLWTAAIAGLLALGRWIATPEDVTSIDLAETAIILLVMVPTFAAVSLTLALPSAALVLGNRRCGWAAVWLAMMATLATILLCSMIYWSNWMSGLTVSLWEDFVEAAKGSLLIHAGLLTMLLAGLILVRLIGFRLRRWTEQAETPVVEPVEEATWIERRVPPWRFPLVVAALALLITTLLWPLWKAEQRWHRQLRYESAMKEWEELGVTVTMEDERIVSIDSDGPLTTAALKKLRNSPHADSVLWVSLSGTIGDEQMEFIAGLKNLETLLLDGTQITGAGLVHLQGLSKLNSLSLEDTTIDDGDVAALPALESLEFLYLSGTNVTEAGLAHLKEIPNLLMVSLEDTEVSEEVAREFNDELAE